MTFYRSVTSLWVANSPISPSRRVWVAEPRHCVKFEDLSSTPPDDNDDIQTIHTQLHPHYTHTHTYTHANRNIMASFVRTFKTLCRTPLVRQPSAGSPLTIELASFPVRPSMSSRISSSLRLQARPQTFRAFSTTPARLASDKGKMELYSDESGSLGAGIDDVAKSDAAYDTSKGPEEAAEGVEKEVSRSVLVWFGMVCFGGWLLIPNRVI
jgi:hypothetical protein